MLRKSGSLLFAAAVLVSTGAMAQNQDEAGGGVSGGAASGGVAGPAAPEAPPQGTAPYSAIPEQGPLPAGDQAGSNEAAAAWAPSPTWIAVGAAAAGAVVCIAVCGGGSNTTTTTTTAK